MSGIAQPYQGYEAFQLFGDKKVAIAPPEVWVAFFTTAPDSNGLNWVEVSTTGTGYARNNFPNTNTTWGVIAGSQVILRQSIRYPAGTVNWGSVAAWGFFVGPGPSDLLMLWGEILGPYTLIVDGFPVLVGISSLYVVI